MKISTSEMKVVTNGFEPLRYKITYSIREQRSLSTRDEL